MGPTIWTAGRSRRHEFRVLTATTVGILNYPALTVASGEVRSDDSC